MSTFVDNIIDCFTSLPLQEPTVKEDERMLSVEFTFNHEHKKTPHDNPVGLLSTRDTMTIRWKDLDVDDYDNTDFLSTNDNWDDFLEDFSASTDENLSLLIEVSKNIGDHILSVYDYKCFSDYFVNLCPADFIHIVDSLVNDNCTTFEIQENTFAQWEMGIISFSSKGSLAYVPRVIENRNRRLELWRHTCRSNLQDIHLLPDDFYLNQYQVGNPLTIKVHDICNLLSLSFIVNDTAYADNYIHIHLTGYSVIDENVDLKQVHLDPSRWNLYEIYKWVYANEQIYDKLNISRNILSLNAQTNLMNLPDEVLGIMVSNHKIFITENVDRFIRVRNDISNFLLDYRSKVDEAISKYIDSMAHNMLVIASFILTTIILKAISKTGFDDFVFPKSILWIIFVLIAISAVQLVLNYKMISEKEPAYNKILGNTRKQYAEILDYKELRILDDADKYWNKKKWCVTIIWIVILAIMATANLGFMLWWLK